MSWRTQDGRHLRPGGVVRTVLVMTAITVSGLRKAYDSHEAVRGVSFEVQHGEVFCLLGPNRAGKSTTVEILEGHRRADAGHVDVLGLTRRAATARCSTASGSCCRAAGCRRR